MTRSSRSRRTKAKAKKRIAKNLSAQSLSVEEQAQEHTGLTQADKRYMICFAILALLITAGYWSLGGRNLFVFPAVFCISVGARKYWSGPVRRFADHN